MAQQQGLLGGRYRLDATLGRGGMGTVWRAHDEILDRDVAVKEVLLPHGLGDAERQVLYERTFREARASARLNHPGVVTVHDVIEEGDRPWIVMEYVRARSLQEIIDDDGPVTPQTAADIGRQTLDALRHAHTAGILHRDVKPSNVLITDEGRAVLTDFGIAQMEGDATLTQTGLVMGSPAYIAPERAKGERAVPASDLWALGATLYAAVEGKAPYERSDAIAALAASLTEPVPPPRNAGPLAQVLDGLLAREPQYRLTADQALPLLTEITSGPARSSAQPAAGAAATAIDAADQTRLDHGSGWTPPPPLAGNGFGHPDGGLAPPQRGAPVAAGPTWVERGGAYGPSGLSGPSGPAGPSARPGPSPQPAPGVPPGRRQEDDVRTLLDRGSPADWRVPAQERDHDPAGRTFNAGSGPAYDPYGDATLLNDGGWQGAGTDAAAGYGPAARARGADRPVVRVAIAVIVVVAVVAGIMIVNALSRGGDDANGDQIDGGPRRPVTNGGQGTDARTVSTKGYTEKDFSVVVPASWTRSENGASVYWHSSDRTTVLQVDRTAWRGPAQVQAEKADERAEANQRLFPEYESEGVREIPYRDSVAVDWEFTFNDPQTSNPMHAVDRFVRVAGRPYAIYFRTPQTEWNSARLRLDGIYRTFRTTG